MFPCRLSFNRLSIGAVAVALLAGGAALAQDGRAVTPGSSADARARREASLLPSGRPATPEGHEALAPIYTPIFLTSINYPRIYGARTYDTRPTYFTSYLGISAVVMTRGQTFSISSKSCCVMIRR